MLHTVITYNFIILLMWSHWPVPQFCFKIALLVFAFIWLIFQFYARQSHHIKLISRYPGARSNYPGISEYLKILQMPGYPGYRYSSLDTLHPWEYYYSKIFLLFEQISSNIIFLKNPHILIHQHYGFSFKFFISLDQLQSDSKGYSQKWIYFTTWLKIQTWFVG
jgi:hypothetical protein